MIGGNGKSAMLVGCGYKDEPGTDSTNVLVATNLVASS